MATRKYDISTGDIKSQMLGYKDVSGTEVIERLKSEGYVSIEGNRLQISDSGKNYIEDLEQRELEFIHNLVFDDYDLALIGFLYNRNDFVRLEDFPEILKTMAPQHGKAINDGNLLQSLYRLKPYIDDQYQWYIINDTGKAFYKRRNPNLSPTQQTNSAPHSNSTTGDLDIPVLKESERLWLSELYKFTVKGERFTYRQLWAKLNSQIPTTFKTAAVDDRLMSSDGATIRILGVVALEGNNRIIDQINIVINAIRKMILNNGEVRNIPIDEIALATGLPKLDISLCLELARYYINLFNESSYKENSTILLSIDVGGSESIFYTYLHFEGIQYYLQKKTEAVNGNGHDYFSKSERESLNEKLDLLMEMMKKVTLSQEFTYDDMMQEFSELKDLYGLKKKDWRRLLAAKIADMTAGGVVSSIMSEPIADGIKPVLNKLLE
ncbi:hypothetical protein [Paraflavitalea sp. CAU 1676]|uniref:hypothetical protein n=1 Tax=Paraflavitalea sp. CAU 1676 TaxID=3032598 RepID=UPI0023DB4BCF|nr:hypothetical protein [Paraflavitalea sp. CAU 1676]MDF2189843.1 hypothetical protein [Paraflavitalea sp. CAU 1676]